MKILHLDDNHLALRSMQRVLRDTFDEVVSVATAEEAMAQLEEVDFLLSDWQLARGTSREVVMEAKRIGLPVIVLSGMPPTDIEVPIMFKGCSMSEVVDEIHRHI